MQAEISELSALALGLWSDLNECDRHLRPGCTGFWDRMHVRALFAMVEGVTYRMRQMLIAGARANRLRVSQEELYVLEEKRYEADGQGRLREADNFMRFLSGFRFTLNVFCRCYGLENELQRAIGDNGFRDFQAAVEIRDRLTHPKQAAELMVRDPEQRTIESAKGWYLTLMTAMLGASFSAELPVENA